MILRGVVKDDKEVGKKSSESSDRQKYGGNATDDTTDDTDDTDDKIHIKRGTGLKTNDRLIFKSPEGDPGGMRSF